MQPGFEGRAEYLSLALFSQRLAAELADFKTHNDLEKLYRILPDALKSLDDVRSGEVKRFGRRDAVAFNTYEQLSALTKAWSPEDLDLAIRLIGRFLASDSADRAAEATKLIELFTKLQVQALWNFERPGTPPTEGLRQLCRMTP